MNQANKTIVGMVHLSALPGSPRHQMSLEKIEAAALKDAEALVENGIRQLMVENFGDVPFWQDAVPPIVIASMTRIASRIRDHFSGIPLGINVRRNDGMAALAVAHAVEAQFIRVNVLCGARVTDQGIIQGIAAKLLRSRRELCAESIQVWADVNVKHSGPLTDQPVEEQVADTVHRGLADALIASGTGTGQPTDLAEVQRFRRTSGETPIYVGSGVTLDNIQQLLEIADGVIVGTALKHGADPLRPIDPAAVRRLIASLS